MKTSMNTRFIPLKLWMSLMMGIIFTFPLLSQQILLDKPVKAGELTLFPDLNDQNAYYYLSDKPRIGLDDKGRPQFSFLRFVENKSSDSDEKEKKEGEGGGIVHAVVQLGVTEDQLRDARTALRRINNRGKIEGPVVYRGGTIALISSFTNTEGELTKQVIGLGKAPILDGQKAAISMELTKKGAKILWQSFKTPTPDMSISFEMELSGFRSPIRALLEANFDQVYEHKNFQAAVASPILAAEIKASFDDLVKNGAIKLTQVGEDENLDKLIEMAYSKLTRMMFEPVEGTGTPNLGQLSSTLGGNSQPSMLDRATTMLNTANRQSNIQSYNVPDEQLNRDITNEEAAEIQRNHRQGDSTNARNPQRERTQNGGGNSAPSLAIAASFEMKRVRQRGTFTLDFNKYLADNLVIRFDENFGQINCKACFREINLDDPLYKQREIVAFLDGLNLEDFGKYVNYVNVIMKKDHEEGDITIDEVRIDRKNFNASGNNFKMLYGWKGDNNRKNWEKYKFKTEWNFFGGIKVENDWEEKITSTIPIAPPFRRTIIDLEADPDIIKDAGVRFIEIVLHYEIAGQKQAKRLKLNTKSQQFSGQLEIIQAPDKLDYEYEITWHIPGKPAISSGVTTSNSSILFVDNLSDKI